MGRTVGLSLSSVSPGFCRSRFRVSTPPDWIASTAESIGKWCLLTAVPARRRRRPFLAEAEDVAIGISHRDLLHSVGLNGRSVDDEGRLGHELAVQRLDIVDPEEHIPCPSLAF